MPPARRPGTQAGPRPPPPPHPSRAADESVAGWFLVLLAARRLERENARHFKGPGFFSRELARECGFLVRFGARRAMQVASAWCSKLERWGYLRSDVRESGGRGRSKLYLLTDYGRGRKPPRRKR